MVIPPVYHIRYVLLVLLFPRYSQAGVDAQNITILENISSIYAP